jgi:hypothetical protein
MKGTYVPSPPAPILADDVVLGPVHMGTEDEQQRYGQKADPPPGAVLVRTTYTDRDGVIGFSQDTLGRSGHCIMVAGDLTLYVSLRSDGEVQLLFEQGREDEPGYRKIMTASYDHSTQGATMRSAARGGTIPRRRRSAIDSVE